MNTSVYEFFSYLLMNRIKENYICTDLVSVVADTIKMRTSLGIGNCAFALRTIRAPK